MPVVKLTQRLVDDLLGAAAPGKDAFYWSDRMAGFGAKHKAGTGRVSWVMQWRDPKSGNSHRLALGDAAKVRLDRAKAAAETRFGDIAAGRNPIQERREYRDAPTFRELTVLYLASDVWKAKAPSTRANDKSRIDVYFIPAFGDWKANDITELDVRRLQRDLADPERARQLALKAGRTRNVVRGGEVGARRTMRFFKALMSFAVDEKLIATNPAADLKLGGDPEREAIPDTDAYTRFWAALERLRPTSYTMTRACDVLALLALTGARKSEIRWLLPRHVDLGLRRIVLPPKEHKTGRKTARSRIISLPDDAVAILAGYAGTKPDEPLFAGLKPKVPVALSRPWELVAEAAQLPPDVTPNSLRHGLGTVLATAGMTAPQISGVLGHRRWSTSQRYVHAVDRARDAAAQAGADLIRPKKLNAVS